MDDLTQVLKGRQQRAEQAARLRFAAAVAAAARDYFRECAGGRATAMPHDPVTVAERVDLGAVMDAALVAHAPAKDGVQESVRAQVGIEVAQWLERVEMLESIVDNYQRQARHAA